MPYSIFIMDHKFQCLQEVLSCKPLIYNAASYLIESEIRLNKLDVFGEFELRQE